MDDKLNKITRKHGKHTAYNLNYYIVFCPKYRKSVLVGDIAIHTEEIIRHIADKVNVKIENLTVAPDHVRVFLSAPPRLSPQSIVKRLKGATANILRQKYPQLLRLPTLWSSSYYVCTVGSVSDSVVSLYIENQRGK